MKRAILSITLLLAFFGARPAAAANTQLLVQSNLGTAGMNFICLLKGCQVTSTVYASPSNFFVLSFSGSVNVSFLCSVLQSIPGILNVTALNGGDNPLGNRYIVRTTGGLLNLPILCRLLLCQILQPLDGTLNQVFLLSGPSSQNPNVVLSILRAVPGILNAELDQVVNVASGSAQADTPPPALVDSTPVSYYGSTVWEGYVNQPAAQVIRLAQAQQQFNVTGTGIIADIDTGVDPSHPVLRPVLLPGYDFTRNQPGASEMNDLPSGSSTPESPCVNCTPGKVNQHSIAMVDQHSIAMVDGPGYEAFGHGTMVAGVLHLVAPTAQILPLKAFGPDGSGNLSDILRAIYYAAQNSAKIVNMSFDLKTPSQELANAVNSAQKQGIVFVASSGNDGQMEMVYPAGLANVMGVASTNYRDQRSTFSNYGYQIVWVAAPGEAVITTYPFGTYAAAWGTSFSAPMVSGGVSLLQARNPSTTQLQAQFDMAQAQLLLAYGMGNGRIDLYRALAASRLP
jgi:subtilisin family serine protease